MKMLQGRKLSCASVLLFSVAVQHRYPWSRKATWFRPERFRAMCRMPPRARQQNQKQVQDFCRARKRNAR